MKVNRYDHRIDTTLGDLIATISDVAFENSDGAEEAYELARLVLMEILRSASFRSELQDRQHSSNKYLH